MLTRRAAIGALAAWPLVPGLTAGADVPAESSGLPAEPEWPQFRGYRARGLADGKPPRKWDLQRGENVLWSVPLEGLAHSGPIVANQRVFLTDAVSESSQHDSIPTGFVGGSGQSVSERNDWRWQIASFDLQTGRRVWTRTVAGGRPQFQRHLKSTHANSTPATDGRYVVASFGSEGLYCLDFDGRLVWSRQLGPLHSGPYDAPRLEWGFASSPIIHDGKVVLQCDCLNTGFIAVFDLEDGRELTRIARDDVATWSTPTIVESESGTQLVCNGYKQMAGYDWETGEMLWVLSGGGDVPVPAPFEASGLILIANGHGLKPVYAISPAARGDITPPRAKTAKPDEQLPEGLVWWLPRGGAYIPTPIAVGDLLYTCSSIGVLVIRNVKTGEQISTRRIGGQYSASAVASPDHVYLCSEDGRVTVVSTGTESEIVARNDMQDPMFATPAIAGNRLLIRTLHGLHCIGPN